MRLQLLKPTDALLEPLTHRSRIRATVSTFVWRPLLRSCQNAPTLKKCPPSVHWKCIPVLTMQKHRNKSPPTPPLHPCRPTLDPIQGALRKDPIFCGIAIISCSPTRWSHIWTWCLFKSFAGKRKHLELFSFFLSFSPPPHQMKVLRLAWRKGRSWLHLSWVMSAPTRGRGAGVLPERVLRLKHLGPSVKMQVAHFPLTRA